MAQQYGLGRGLASLIPPKKPEEDRAAPPSVSVAPNDQREARVLPPKGSVSPVNNDSPLSTSTSFFTPPVVRAGQETLLEIPLEKIAANPHQPRLHFDEAKLTELVASIREHGILQPLVVSRASDGYELIAGERRFQAAKRLGLKTVPAVIRDVSEQQKLELAIIENIQRHNLNPIEEAKAYSRLLDEFGMQQEAVARQMGKSRSSVANTLRLLHLPIEIQRAVSEGKISEGHAKALLAIENPEKQRAVFALIIKEELTVRETEMRVRSIAVKPHLRSAQNVSPELARHMELLTERLGTKVRIVPTGRGGKVVIEYYSAEDLDGLLRRLT